MSFYLKQFFQKQRAQVLLGLLFMILFPVFVFAQSTFRPSVFRVSPGEKVGDLVLVNKSVEYIENVGVDITAEFSGEITVSGDTYYNSLFDEFCFLPDRESELNLLPRFLEDGRMSFFCFSNKDEAKKILGDVNIDMSIIYENRIPVTALISGYTYHSFGNEGDSTALLSVSKKVPRIIPVPVSTQATRSYSYDTINYNIHVNQDTTVDVIETQEYRFVGEYHQGWRNIPKKGIDDLTDVSVIDGATKKVLLYSPTRLEKTSPASWGKYTTFFENGEYIIEWYYNAKDTTSTWEIHYKLRGAISFYQDHDEFYWNLFTAYSVPISKVDVDVILPSISFNSNDLKASFYADSLVRGNHRSEHSDVGFHFFANDILSGAQLTIAPGWPKGVVDQGAYQKYWFGKNWGYVGAIAIALITVIVLILRWYFTERYHVGRGLVIPEYEPPKDLPPAMADILVHESLSSNAWAATVVDLAIRGYIKIEEKEKGKMVIFFVIVVWSIVLFFYGFLLNMFIHLSFFSFSSWGSFFVFFLLFLIILFRPLKVLWSVFLGKVSLQSIFLKTDYVLTRIISADAIANASLHDYEKGFLHTIFSNSGRFDMSTMKDNPSRSQKLYKDLQELQKSLELETTKDTNAYDIDFRAWRISKIILTLTGALTIGGLVLALVSGHTNILFFPVFGYSLLILFLFFRYNPRLNKQGQIIREEWLGFKLYLETAEKNRMQNLTPEIFEKYLPYAIIFGVEKKWGKAFEGMTIPQPSWYGGSSMATGSSLASSSGGFSASVFSASFSSSFSSAFSSAGGGGGASGGGGGAGGGGGGGGGGAS